MPAPSTTRSHLCRLHRDLLTSREEVRSPQQMRGHLSPPRCAQQSRLHAGAEGGVEKEPQDRQGLQGWEGWEREKKSFRENQAYRQFSNRPLDAGKTPTQNLLAELPTISGLFGKLPNYEQVGVTLTSNPSGDTFNSTC